MRSKPTRRFVVRELGVGPAAPSPSSWAAAPAAGPARRPGSLLARLSHDFLEPLESRVHLSVSRDASGFTVVTPATDSRIVYVSAAGNDVNTGASMTAAVATVKRAREILGIAPGAQTRDDVPDQILFRRGDVFKVSSDPARPQFGRLTKWGVSGRSASEPFVIGAYTDPAKPSAERPRIESGKSSAITLDYSNGPVSNVYVLGVAFEAEQRDYREQPAGWTTDVVDDGQGGTYGMNLYGASNGIWVEDASFQYYRGGIAANAEGSGASAKRAVNLTIRRSEFLDNYAKSFGASGGYITSEGVYASTVNGLTLEENVFDHNGWTDPSYGYFGSYPTIYNHGAYIHATNENVRVVGNVFANSASHGLQARAGGVIKNNLFINNPIAMSYGYVNGAEKAGGVYGEISGNVVYGSRDLNGSNRGWGLEIANTRPIGSTYGGGGTVVKNNIYTSYATNAQPAIQVSFGTNGSNPQDGVGINDLTIQNNIVYGWNRGMLINPGFGPGATSRYGLNNLKVLNNEFQQVTTTPIISHGSTFSSAEETWSGNRYNLVGGSTTSNSFFTVKGSGTSFAQWKAQIEPTASTAPIVYPAPNRSPGSYNASLGGTGTIDAFLDQARRQSSRNWRTQYTAAAAASYIAAGFSGQRVDGQPPAGQLLAPNITAGGGATQTFNVTWSDDTQVNAASIGAGDVVVTGPNGYSQAAALVSTIRSGDGTTVTATYSVPAPGGAWSAAGNGTYAVATAAGQVTDANGNAAPAGQLGTFTVSIVAAAPTAALAAVATVTTPAGAATLVVTYAVASGTINTGTIGANDLVVSGPTGNVYAATFVSKTPATGNAATITATYQLAAPPDGGWTADANGAYEVTILSGAVATATGVQIGQATLGTFQVNVSVPTAIAVGPSITSATSADQTVTVTYTAADGINALSVDVNDLRITGPNGFFATPTGVARTGDGKPGTPLVAVYTFPAPAGGFTAAYNGEFQIVLQAGQVTGVRGNTPAPAGTIGTFAVNFDSQAPVATSVTPNVYAASAATALPITVEYTDPTGVSAGTVGAGDIEVVLPDGSRVVATYKSQTGTGAKVTAVYELAMAGGVTAARNGLYTVYLGTRAVSDTAGNFTPDGAYAGEFRILVDATRPALVDGLYSGDVTAPNGTVDFTVRFRDYPGVDGNSFDNQDVLVTGPNGFRQFAELISFDTTGDDAVDGGSLDNQFATAVYRLQPPAGGWRSAQNGAGYAAFVQPNQIFDLAGNAAAGDDLIAFFAVNVPAVFAGSVDPVPNPQPGLNGLTIRFTQAPTNFDLGDLRLTRNGGANLLPAAAQLVRSDASTYQLTGLTGLTGAAGNYVLTLPAAAGVTGDGGAALSADVTYAFTIGAATDAAAPTFAVQAPTLTTATAAAYAFTVTWTDATAVSVASLGTAGGVYVTAPGSAGTLAATLASVDVPTDGSPRTATYSVAAPAGGWAAANNGAYAISAAAGAITDTVGNAVAAQQLGTFAVAIPVAPPVDTTPPTVAIAAVTPTPRTTPVPAATVLFSEPVTGFDLSDLTLTRGGNAVALTGATLTSSDGATFTVGGLTSATTAVGAYVLSVKASGTGVADAAGNALSGGATTAFTVQATVPADTTPPTVAIAAVTPSPRSVPVDAVTVTFSEPVSGFDLTDLALTRGGTAVPLTGATLTTTNGTTFALSGLSAATAATGTYALSVKSAGTGIVDAAGNALSGTATAGWVTDATGPTASATAADVTAASAAPVTITVAYADNLDLDPATFDGNDLLVTGPNGYAAAAAFVGATGSGATRSATYQLAAPAGGWAAANNGAYTIALQAGQVADALGNPAAAGPVGSFAVAVPPPVATGLPADGGFETPVVGANFGAYRYGPAGSPWAFAGHAGVSGNATEFTYGNPAAPEGAQVGFVQDVGSAAQAFTTPAAGRYVVGLRAAQRGTGQASYQVLDVRIDGASVGTVRPAAGGAYEAFATAAFDVPAGTHTLALVGLNPAGGDNTAFVDAVALTQVPAVPPAIPATNPAPVADLYNSTTDAKIGTLADGYVIDMSKVGTKLNVLGLAVGTAPGSVRFLIDGVEERTESVAPFTIGGDNGPDLADWTPAVGQHTLQLVQYSGSNGAGTVQAASAVLRLTVLPPDTAAPTVAIAAVAPNPRATPVDSATVTFSEPVNGFDPGDLILTRGGTAVALTGVTVSTVDGKAYTVSGLTAATAAAGSYVLSVKSSGTGIADVTGNALVTGASAAWTTTATTATPAVTAVSPNPVTGSAAAQNLVVTGTSFGTAGTVTLRNLTTGAVVTPAVVSRSGATQITVSAVLGTAAGNWSAQVSNGGLSSAQFTFAVAAPTTALGIAVAPNPVTGKTAALTAVNGGSNSATKFTWSVTTKPSGATAPTFSANGTNAAKAATVTFSKAGSYTLKLTSTTGSTTATASATFTVNQTVTTVTMSPATATLARSVTKQFAATAKDQFGAAMTPTFAWSVDAGGVGAVNASGLYIAPPTDGKALVRATAGGASATANITVFTAAKVNFQPASAAFVSGYMVDSGLTYADRNSRTYGWSTDHSTAVVDRGVNSNQLLDTNVGVKAGAKWEMAVPNGTYTVKVSVGDAGAASTNTVILEGSVTVFGATKLNKNVFSNKTSTVTVTDGKLTLSVGSAATGATRIDYLEITKT